MDEKAGRDKEERSGRGMATKTRRDLIKTLAGLAAIGYLAPKVVRIETAQALHKKGGPGALPH